MQETRVVKPTDVWVLEPTDRASLTLVTCYPFNYFGAAPQRFIVRATLAETAAANAPSHPCHDLGRMEYGISPPAYRLPDATRLGPVRLQISSLQQSLEY